MSRYLSGVGAVWPRRAGAFFVDFPVFVFDFGGALPLLVVVPVLVAPVLVVAVLACVVAGAVLFVAVFGVTVFFASAAGGVFGAGEVFFCGLVVWGVV